MSPGENNEWELGYIQIPFIKETLRIPGDQKTFDQEVSRYFYLKLNSRPTETKHQKVKKFCESSYKIVRVLEDLIVKKIENDDNIIDKNEFMKKVMFRICFEYFKTHTIIYGRRTVRYQVEELTRSTTINNVEINFDYSDPWEAPKYYSIQLFREDLKNKDIITWWREPSYFDNPDIKIYLESLPEDSNIRKLFERYSIDIELLFQKIKE